MTMPSKVLWAEGVFLRPQHFQQQDRYHEARVAQIAQALHPYLWGVQRLELDGAALARDTLRLDALCAIFRDGEIVDAPDSDLLPPAIDLSTLPATVQEITYYAALPALARDGSNYRASGTAAPQHDGDAARFAQADHATPDLFTQAVPADVAYLRKAPRLLSDLDPRGSFDCLPLVRLRRLVSGGFEPDPAFVAPAVSLAGAPPLRAGLEQLLEALQAKVNALQGHMREPSRNVIEFRSGDVSAFWLLHTVSTAAASLRHYLHHPGLHPERLFEALLGLSGALMTYSKNHQLAGLPAYRHEAPGECFGQLDTILRELLDTVISSRCFTIALTEARPSYHVGKLDSGRIDAGTRLYLAIGAALPALELVDIVPVRVKVGAPDDVEKCVLTALPGVKIAHAPQVPAAIPMRPETCYFVLENRGVLYEQMLKAQSITIYVPAGIRDLRVELIAVTA